MEIMACPWVLGGILAGVESRQHTLRTVTLVWRHRLAWTIAAPLALRCLPANSVATDCEAFTVTAHLETFRYRAYMLDPPT